MRSLRFTIAAVGLCAVLLSLCSCASTPEAKSAKFIEAGKKLMQKYDTARAILQFQSAVKITPRNPEAHYQLAAALLAAGDVMHASIELRRSLELNPKHQGAELLMAKLLASTNDKGFVEDAEKRLQALLQDSPDDPDALHALAFTELKLGAPNDAVRDLERAMVSAPQNLMIAVTLAQAKLQAGDPKGAEAALKQASQNAPKSTAALVMLGKFFVMQGRLTDAQQAYQQGLAIDANDPDALLALGSLQIKMGNKPEAEQTFTKLSRTSDKQKQGTLAAYLSQEGRKAESLQEVLRLAKADPADRRIRTWLVNSYLAMDRKPDAEKLLTDALKKNPRDLDALLQRGEIALGDGDFNKAENDLNQVMHMQVNSPEVHYVMGKLYLARKEDLRYRQELTEVLKLSPGLQSVRVELAQNFTNIGEGQAALDILNAAPEIQKSAIPMLVQRNWALWVRGDLAEMRKGIEKGLAQERAPDFLVQDGLLKLRTGDAKGARAALEEALKIDPSDLRALRVLSRSYVAEKNGKAAIQKVKDYAALQPKSAAVQDFLGVLLFGSGERAEARTAFAAAKAADPHFVKADLSLVQVDVAEGKVTDARNRLQGMVSTDGKDLTARRWLGNIAEMAGDHKTAIEQFRKVVEANPSDAQALNNLAYLLTEYGNDTNDALKQAQRAVELVPERAAYCDTLGWVLYRKGLYSSAIPYMQRASADPQNVVWKYHLAMAYAKAGDRKNGRMVLQAAIKINPNVPEAKIARELMDSSQ